MKILIVEDEIIPQNYLLKLIQNAGYNVVSTAETGKDAIRLARIKKPDLILMDIMLEDGISGIDAAIQIKQMFPDIIIIFLTAYSEESMIESAIDAHASGYFLKPYNKPEILANLKLIASRIQPKTQDSHTNTNIQLIQGYTYNTLHKQLYLHHKDVYLSQKELKVIHLFCTHCHQVLDFQTIINYIWDEKKSQQGLRSLIYRIREKTSPNLIINVNKMGYKIALKN